MKTNSRLQTLDALRGVAAIVVVLFHVSQAGNNSNFAPNGYLAVDFFFILSGLVISRTFEGRLKGGMSVKTFAISRIIRLYPVFLLGLLLDGARRIIVVTQGKDYGYGYSQIAQAFLSELFFIPSVKADDQLLFLINPPAWSLLTEVLLNIIFALTLYRLRSKLLAVTALIAFVILAYQASLTGTYSMGAYWYDAAIGPLRGLFGFSVGILIARTCVTSTTNSWRVLAVIATLIFVLFLPDTVVINTLVIGIILPGIVIVGSRIEPPPALNRLFSMLGEASYPMYAIHFAMMYSLNKILIKIGVTGNTTFYVASAIVFFAGLAVSRFYEIPIRRMLTRVFLTSSRPALASKTPSADL